MSEGNDIVISPVDRLVMPDGYHCDPECPHLRPDADTTNVFGKCALSGKDLDWHDWYVADCVEKET